MKHNKWRWIAEYKDGSIIKQPPEPAAFLGNLDIAKVKFFEVKKRGTSFYLDVNNGTFFKNGVLIFKGSDRGPRSFYCVRRVIVSQDNTIEKKIIFGFNKKDILTYLIIDKDGRYEKIA